MQKPFIQLGQRQNLIRQFTPNWFTFSMGTGVVALIVSEFPMLKAFTWQLGTGLWYFNILLFVLFSVLYGLRWAFYPHEAKQIFQHPSMSLFLGTIPMALATILNGFLTNCAKFSIYNLWFRWRWIARLFVIQVFLDFLYIPELHQL